MPQLSWLEAFGYAASVVVAVSLMMSSILKLRWWNLAGAAAFSLYGLLIHAYPVAVLNGFIALADAYYLIRMYGTREDFRAIPVPENSAYLACIFEAHREEILRIFPRFDLRGEGGRVGFFVLRNLVPAACFLGTPRAEGVLEADLDFALPAYRDLRPGAFLFQERLGLFRELGIRRIEARSADPAHCDYLRRVGFAEEAPVDGQRTFALVVA